MESEIAQVARALSEELRKRRETPASSTLPTMTREQEEKYASLPLRIPELVASVPARTKKRLSQ